MVRYVNMNDILEERKEIISFVNFELKTNGWCFVKFSNAFNNFLKNSVEKINKFFDLPNNIKSNYQYENGLGYKTFFYKDHLHVLTGNYNIPNFDEILNKSEIEKDAAKVIKNISFSMDKSMLRLTNILSKHVFNLTLEHAEKISIYGKEKAGLLDFVKYKKISMDKNILVKEHCDPGLMSVNIYSDAPGMQFYDILTSTWITMPLGYGAIFCGQAAKMFSNIPAAKHRVFNNGTGRFSIWYEIGVKSQLPEKNTIKRKETKILGSENEGNNDIIKVYVYEKDIYSNPREYILYKNKNDTVFGLKTKLEEDTGIPTSKTITKRFLKIGFDDYNNYSFNEKIENGSFWIVTINGYLDRVS
jgi:isopenicillin N synthase-like dioxygenase